MRARRRPIPDRDEEAQSAAKPGYTLGLLGLLVELLLPVTLCAALLLVLAGYTPYWDLRGRLGLGIFGVLLVVLSLVLSVRLDAWTLARRRRRGNRQLLNRTGARARQLKFLLGGVVVPIAALVAATRLQLPNHQTPMAMALELRLSRRQVSHEERLGDAVLRAQAPARLQGIHALQVIGSPEALEQLFRVVRQDPDALKDGNEAQALSVALASYGERARPGLLQLLAETDTATRQAALAPPGDLFDRHFAAPFAALEREVDGRPGQAGTPAAEAEGRLQLAQDDLRRSLAGLEAEARPSDPGTSRPGFVLHTFLQMDLKEDSQLLRAARAVAADPGWSDPVRGQALLLMAKLGGKDDLDALYARLDQSSPPLQARAMQAIAQLQAKLNAH
ncbi:MAG TPA: hypothetical protein VEQ10_07835 [Vicinamibacteria bacterium]|nr:hypothetical protein [Vicinamibacteria bacterium]